MIAHSLRKPLSLLLVFCLCLSLLAVPAGATETDPFHDVNENDWYSEAVSYVTDQSLMNGTASGQFSPNAVLTRAMVTTVLYRKEGSPAVSGTIPFSDVPEQTWYSDAVLWGSREGLLTGYPDGTFGPDRPITRGEMVTILYRYQQEQQIDVSADVQLDSFADGTTVSDWLRAPVAWAVSRNILSGIGSGGTLRLALNETATRGQFSKILMQCFRDDAEPVPPTAAAPGGAAPVVMPKPEPKDPTAIKEPIVLFDVSAIAGSAQCTPISGITAGLSEGSDIPAGTELTDALSSSGTATVRYYIVLDNAQDASDYTETGALHFFLWSENATTCTVELGSSPINDEQELQWAGVSLDAGWNEIALPLSDAGVPKPGDPIDLTGVLRLRIFDTTKASSRYLLGDVSLYHQQYLPCNTTGDAARDIAIAQAAIAAGLQAEYGGSTVDVRVRRDMTSRELSEKVVSTIRADLADYLRNVEQIYNVAADISYVGSDRAVIRLTMEEEAEIMGVTLNFIYFEQQSVQLVSGSYTGSEKITASVVLGSGSYLLDATGETDCTAVIQAALDDCGYSGGGVVWLPAGQYRITGTLTVPAYVTLRGDWQDPDTASGDALRYGTILLADPADPAKPLLYMGGSSGVNGLTVFYPRQNPADPIPYAYTIYNEGKALQSADRGLHTIKNITLLNAYKGIGFCDTLYSRDAADAKAEQSYILQVKGTFLHTGMYAFNSSDNGGTIGFTAKPDYWTSFLGSAACGSLPASYAEAKEKDLSGLAAYTRANAVGLHIGDLEGDYFSNITLNGLREGIVIDRGARTTYYGDLFGLDISGCGTGLRINTLSGFGVNIACSAFTHNDTDIRNNSKVAVKLTKVSCSTVAGDQIYTTSDDTLTETPAISFPAYGVTGTKLAVLHQMLSKSRDFRIYLQNALDQVGAAGGGIVWLAPGHYVLDAPVSVPANTELRGSAGSAVKPVSGVEGGTVLEVRFAGGQDPADGAAIRLTGSNSGISGLILVYPYQTPNTPSATGYGVRGTDASQCFVANCSILGFSHGVLLENCDGYTVDGVTFSNFDNNITARNCNGGTISRCLQNTTPLIRNSYSYRDWSTLETGTDTPAFAYTSDHLNCIVLDGSVNQTVTHWYAYRPHDTVTLKNGSQVLMVNNGAGGARNTQVGALIRTDRTGTALSINSHQKNRITTDAPAGAAVRAYNRMTLDGSTLVTGEDSYVSAGADSYTLIEPGSSLLSANARPDGYDLSKGGTISCETNYAQYGDIYDLSDYQVLAIDLATARKTEAALTIQFQQETISVDVPNGGPQTLYLDLDHFGTDRTAVSAATFQLRAYADARCVLNSVSLLKALPDGAVLSVPASGVRKSVTLITAADTEAIEEVKVSSATTQQVVSISNAPAAEELLSDTLRKLTSTKPLISFKFAAANISEYRDNGYLHFYLHLPKEAVDNKCVYRVELTSSGAADKDELQLEFGPASSFYPIKLTAGWNELWLPLAGAHATGKMDFTAVNFIRFYQQSGAASSAYTLYLDGFELAREDRVDAGIIRNEEPCYLWTDASQIAYQDSNNGRATAVSLIDYGRDGIGLKNASTASGTFQYARYIISSEKHVSAYGGGYLHVSVHVKDAASLSALRNLYFELGSNKKPDSRETQWLINNAHTKFQVGWNELYLPLTKSYVGSSDGYTDLNRVNFFRFFFTGNTGAAELVLADMYCTMTAPETISDANLIVVP